MNLMRLVPIYSFYLIILLPIYDFIKLTLNKNMHTNIICIFDKKDGIQTILHINFSRLNYGLFQYRNYDLLSLEFKPHVKYRVNYLIVSLHVFFIAFSVGTQQYQYTLSYVLHGGLYCPFRSKLLGAENSGTKRNPIE